MTNTVEKPVVQFSMELLDEVSEYLSERSRFRLKDVNTLFYNSFVKTLLGNIDDHLLSEPSDSVYHLLQKYGQHFTSITLDHESDFSVEDTFPYAPNIVNITTYDCEVNLLLDIIFFTYPKTIKELCLAYHITANRPDLCQIPLLSELEVLKLYNTTFHNQFLNETFFFVPTYSLTELGISFLDTIDEATLKYFYETFPNLNTLELHGTINDSGLLALNTVNKNLKILSLSVVRLSRPNNSFTLKPEALPNLNVLFLKGNEDIDDTTKVTKLFNSAKYPFAMLILDSFHLTNVSYTFTNHRFPHLSYLSLAKCNFISKDTFLHIFTNLPLITSINLKEAFVEETSILHVLANEKHFNSPVQFLNLEKARIDNQIPIFLTCLPHLYYLNLNDTRVRSSSAGDTNMMMQQDHESKNVLFASGKKSLRHLNTLRCSQSVLKPKGLALIMGVAPQLEVVEVEDEVRQEIEQGWPQLLERVRMVEEIDMEPNFFEIEQILCPLK